MLNRRRTTRRPAWLVQSEFIFFAAPFRSCHASTIVQSEDHLIAAWFGGTAEGYSDVGIWSSRFSHGRWSIPSEIATGVEPDGTRLACFNPILFHPPSGPTVLFYKVGTHPTNWTAFRKVSADGGATWTSAQTLPAGVLGPDKNKPVLLPNGTILCGSSVENDHWRVRFESTDSRYERWVQSKFLNDRSDIDAIQPSVLALSNGRLLTIGRTRQRRLFQATSEDMGASWSPMTLSNLPNPNSGTDALTLADGRHLLVYNHTESGRSPLHVALSEDGFTWTRPQILDRSPCELSYPACIQTSDSLVHVTYTWNRQSMRHVVLDPEKF